MQFVTADNRVYLSSELIIIRYISRRRTQPSRDFLMHHKTFLILLRAVELFLAGNNVISIYRRRACYVFLVSLSRFSSVAR